MPTLPPVSGLVMVTSSTRLRNMATTYQRNTHRQNCILALKCLGMAEVVLGSFCLVVEAILLEYSQHSPNALYYGPNVYDINYFREDSYSYHYRYLLASIGEGIWCGAWIIFAGGIGIRVGKKNSTIFWVNIHLAFCVVGAVFAGVLAVNSSIWCTIGVNSGNMYFSGLKLSIALVAFITMVLQILSVACCCLANSSRCNDACCPNHVAEDIEVTECDGYPECSEQDPAYTSCYIQRHLPISPITTTALKSEK